MEWEIKNPELENLYTQGKSSKFPSIDARIAKKISIRIHQLQTVSDLKEFKQIKSIQLLKTNKPNIYSLLLADDIWLLIQIANTENKKSEKVHIIDIHP